MTIHEYLFVFFVIHITCCIFNIHFIEDYEDKRYNEIEKTNSISQELAIKRIELLYENTQISKSISVLPVLSTIVSLIVVYLLLKD